MTSKEKFVQTLDASLGPGPSDAALRVQRANVLAAVRRGQRPSGRPRWEIAALPLSLAVAVAAAVVWWPDPGLSATWRDGLTAEVTAPLVAGERRETIEFSDGSRVELEPKASAHIVRLEPRHAELSLREGKLTASVRHRDGVSWSVTAGPYEVRVVGTKFNVAWERTSQTLRVDVTEGRVRVSGGDLAGRVVELTPGEHIERRAAPPTAAAPRAAAPGNAVAAPAVDAADPGAITAAPGASAPTVPSLSELLAAGKYADAVARAEQRGFARVLAELPESELLALGNAARYTGASARARQTMLALRERFPGRPASSLAAFYMAKTAEQLDKNPKEAVRWLRVFLGESPNGGLAADARASLLSLLLALGDNAGAAAAAREYLEYHPTGPVADRARVVLARTR